MVRQGNGSARFTCTHCTFSHQDKQLFVRHYELHRDAYALCRECKKPYTNLLARQRHHREHNVVVKNSIRCSSCPWRSRNAITYSSHEWYQHGIRMPASIKRFFEEANHMNSDSQ